jgi:uncharacterized protein YjaG (DUF416 family)
MPPKTFTYSKEEVQRRLEALPSRSRIVFGLSCCERMFRNYMACKEKINWGDEQPLRIALDELWKCVEGAEVAKSAARHMYEACEAVAPNSDDFSELLTTSAQDACFSICSVLDYVQQGNTERIAQASSYAVDTLDLYISALLDGFSKTPKAIFNGAENDEQIRLHPLMQRELARQDADLKLLATNPDLRALKAQWRAPGKSNIDL